MKKTYLLLFILMSFSLAGLSQRADLYVPEKSANIANTAAIKSVQSQPVQLKSATLPGIIWDNGPLVTHPGAGSYGADVSVLQTTLGMNTYGFGFQIVSGNSMADDFTLSTRTAIDSITVFGYQTGSGLTSTFTEVHLQIYNGNPSTGGTIIWGDNTTNRLARTQWSGIYRTLDTDLQSTSRPIMECVCPIETTLDAGTYWIEISLGGTGSSGPWCPPVSILGNTTTGNGLQNIAGSWNNANDGVTLTPQGVPFVLFGATYCPEDITVSTDSSSCGKIIDYVVNVPAKGSYLQTAGLPTGSEFPVGTTTNCFRLIDSLGNESNCCFTVTVTDSIAPVAECKSAGNGNVLLLWDVDNANTQSLKTAIEAKGYTVTMPAVPEYQWDNTNPPLDDFDAVIHLNGETWLSPLPLGAQNALVDFVNIQGKAFIHSEWDAYEIDDMHAQNAMSDITILQRYTGYITDLTYTVVPGKEAHQVLENIPDNFTISYVGHSPTTLRNYATEPAEMLMTDQYGTAAVAVRKFGKGKVVGFNHAGNYDGSDALTNSLVQQLYINALDWAAGSTFQLDKNGQVTISAEDIDGGSTDNCQIATMEIDRTQFTKADLGEQIVTLTVSDYAGNSSTCQSTITITEPKVEKPKAVCQPIDVNLDADGTYKLDSLDMVEITGLSPDSLLTFDDMKIFAYPDTFTCANIEWPVFVRITEYDKDYKKTRCWAMVTVHDSTPPTVVGKDMDLMLDETGLAMITTEQLMDSATVDGCGIDTAYIDKNTFTCANIGENWVILSVADIHGNVGTDSVLVSVTVDIPVIDSIADVDVTTSIGVCETTIDYPLPAINEICGISATLTSGLGRDGLFPVGTTNESWMIIDYKGDTTNVSFNVTVTAPNAFPSFDAIIDSIVVEVENTKNGIMVPIANISYGNDCSVQTVTITAESDNAILVESVTTEYHAGDNSADLLINLVPGSVGRAKITVTVTDSEGASMFRHFEVIVNAKKEGQIATAVWSREIEMGVNMYPNPAKDQVTIDIKDYNAAQTEVSVFTIAGSEVLRKTYFNGETIRFSIKEQVSGVYLVKMNIDGNNITKKLVVDKK